MGPEPSDASEVSPGQSAPVAAAVSDADLSRAVPAPAGGAGTSPDLMVRVLNQDRLLQSGRTYRIGRDPKSDIAISDPRVSWAHGVLRVEGATWVLEDLGSSNGTFLGPDRTQRVEIAGACEARLGHRDNGPVVRFQPQLPAAVAAPRAPEPGVTGGAQAGSPSPAAAPREPTLPGSVTRMTPKSVVDQPTSAADKGPRVSSGEAVPHRRHHRYVRGYLKLWLYGLLAVMVLGLFEILTVYAALEISYNGDVPRVAFSNAGTSWTSFIVVGQIIVLIVLPSVHRRSRPKDWKCGDYGEREKDFPTWMARAAAALFALTPLSLRNGCGLASAAGQCLAQPFHGKGWMAAIFPALVGVAILMPIYRSIAAAFWQYDIRHVWRAPAASLRNVWLTLGVFAAPVVARRRNRRPAEPR